MANPFDDYLEESINSRTTPWQDIRAANAEQLAMIPFYPNQKYLAKNWKPEQYSKLSIEQIARAQALAEKQKLLSSEHGKYFFPTQLIEQRNHDFGMSDSLMLNDNGSNPYEDAARKMQLSPPQLNRNTGNAIYKAIQQTQAQRDNGVAIPFSYAPHYPPPGSALMDYRSAQEENARLAALFFALKGRGKTPEQGAEAWNGSGIVKGEGNGLKASSKNHLSKVQTMLQMLDHPANAEMKKVWQQYYGQAMKELP